jgi:hypothetical protein
MKKIISIIIVCILISSQLIAQVKDSLVLYCSFDDVNSITNPIVGLAGTFNADPELNFTTGKTGNAYLANYMEDTLIFFPKEVIPIDKGCIEIWGKLDGMPFYVQWHDNPSLFHGLTDNPGYPENEWVMMFNGNDGWSGAGLTSRAGNGAASTGCWYYDYSFSELLGDVNTWHHYALSWDIDGVPGSDHKMQMYLDGNPVGNSGENCDGQDRSPTKLNGLSSGAFYIINFMDMNQGSAAIDELKIWNYARTQFFQSIGERQFTNVSIFPNPLSTSTTIEYELKEPGMVFYNIYNYIGQEIALLVSEYQLKGKHQVNWNAEGQPSGIYFYRLTTGNHSSTGKLVVVR